jgi:hypothetical protein
MTKYSFFLLSCFIFSIIGCRSKPVTTERYFYVYYQENELDGTRSNPGDFWFKWNGFPSKRQIDSIIYDFSSKNKECYQPILISYFFEFKSKEDFDAFGEGYHGNLSSTKDKKDCCDFCPSSAHAILEMDAKGNVLELATDSFDHPKYPK